MVFGFGFNKTKILASAEKNVKQGKLQHAIAEYEKILAEDSKDLTVMNTIGDLYARVGNTDKATEYFRKIGDSYASEGFTVRAIAMYKKLTKQDPGALDAVLKLGELYTQQGLYNDARAQFMHVAENHLRNNQHQQAAEVLKKTLDLDPENTSLQTRLAELYVKLGRASDARDLYFRNAEALRTRGAVDLADDALERVTRLDPNFSPAILLRGQVKFDSGDPESAVHLLEQLPDVDSHQEGLRTLLKSHLALGQIEAAQPVARKLLNIFQDSSGITGYGEALMAAGSYEQALDLFSEHAGVMLSENQPAFMQVLQSLTARVKNSPKALEQLSAIFQRAGNTGCLVEITELLAHAYVQEGNLQQARDLYQRLTVVEPENPQHAQNYRQIVARLTERLPEVKESVAKNKPEPDINVPSNSSAAEEAFPASLIEQKYPGDLSELVDAALTDAELFDSYNLASKAIAPLENILPRVPSDVRVNQRLASLYARSGRLKEAAERFKVLERAHVESGYLKDSQHYAELAAKYRQRAGLPVECDKETPVGGPSAVTQTQARAAAVAYTAPAPTPIPAPVPPSPQSHEIDLSAEWDQTLEIQPPDPAIGETHVKPPTERVTRDPIESTSVWDSIGEQTADPASELLDEIRFYVAQSMWPEAHAAVLRCEAIAPENPELAKVKAQVIAAEDAFVQAPDSLGDEIELLSNPEHGREGLNDISTPDPLLDSAAGESFAPPLQTPTMQVSGDSAQASLVQQHLEPAAPADSLFGLVHDLEESLGDDFVIEPATTDSRREITAANVSHESHDDVPAALASAPVPEVTDKAIASTSALPAGFARPATEVPQHTAIQPAVEPLSPVAQAAAEAVEVGEESNALSDIFAEFKQSMESGSEAQEDPETHYNLAVAFKEMDLFDEAIGEFQKVCQAIERGHAFSQPVQAYTWLADCFLKKGVPDAAIRWYERALKTPQIEYETDTAIRYELACACAAAGDRQSALKHFMEVYGTNIDYRDVAERIKSLRS